MALGFHTAPATQLCLCALWLPVSVTDISARAVYGLLVKPYDIAAEPATVPEENCKVMHCALYPAACTYVCMHYLVANVADLLLSLIVWNKGRCVHDSALAV